MFPQGAPPGDLDRCRRVMAAWDDVRLAGGAGYDLIDLGERDDVEVLIQVGSEQALAEDVAVSPPITRVEGVLAREGARQQAVRQRAVGHDPDTELLRGGKHLVLPATVEQVVADLVG